MDYREQRSELFTLSLDEYAKGNFLEAARWAKFLAVVGIVFTALLMGGCLFAGYFLSSLGTVYGSGDFSGGMGIGVSVFYLIIVAIVYIYPVLALYRFAKYIRLGIQTDNQQHFNLAVNYLKGMFRYIGILTIIFLCLYGAMLLFWIIVAL